MKKIRRIMRHKLIAAAILIVAGFGLFCGGTRLYALPNTAVTNTFSTGVLAGM